VPALQLQGFVDSGQHAVGGVRGPRDIGVGQDGKELRRRAAENSWRVDIAYGARKRRGHRFQGFVSRTAAAGFDQEDAKVSLVPMSPRQLVFEHRPDEAFIEESSRSVHDVERLGLWVVGPDPARRAEDRAVRQG
jgi:hypothetical protein